MKRPHEVREVALKVRRARQEFEKHRDKVFNVIHADPNGSTCHCLLGLGAVRKNRPFGNPHAPGRCPLCEAMREEKRNHKKRLRAEGHRKERAVP